MTGEEQPEIGVSVETEWWRTTAPPEAAILAAKPSDMLEVDGVRYLIVGGIKRFTDLNGRLHHVDVYSARQDIG